MQCSNPVRLKMDTKTGYASWRYPDGLTVPCGKCLFCRIHKRKEWSVRMLHELGEHNDNSFITLTYQDCNLPDNSSLSCRHLQLFFKRLRKNLDGRRIKYFACGEYGPRTNRPHYHAILFGVGLSRDDKGAVKESWHFADWNNKYISRKSFGLAEPDSIRYVAQYIDSKLSGALADEVYRHTGREPVFRLLSRGLGARYCDRISSRIADQGYITVNGVKHSIPRYYIKRLGINASDLQSEQAYIREADVMHKLTGFDYSYDEAYKFLRADEVLKYEEAIKNAKAQNVATMTAKLNLYDKKL